MTLREAVKDVLSKDLVGAPMPLIMSILTLTRVFLQESQKELLANPVASSQNSTLLDVIRNIPRQPQKQYSTEEQLRSLHLAANRLGLYDAADQVQKLLEK